MDISCSVDYDENTLKYYYDEELGGTSPYTTKNRRSSTSSLDEFFNDSNKTLTKKCSSTVGRATKEGMMTYVSSNEDDGANATHLIKIEILDLKKLKAIPKEDHWKHPDVRVKCYVNNKTTSIHHQKARKLIYNITKEISSVKNSKKYSFKM